VRYTPATDADLDALRTLAEKYSPLFPRNPRWVQGPGPHSEYYTHVA
jgi:hypothetical protein